MENAVDALKIAAAILIFIIAIASSFSLFGTAKQTADSIISMRDKQAYLEAAELDNGLLYTSSSAIQGETGLTEEQIKDKLGLTKNGDRIVGVDDVVSTISRYSIENYAVTIIDSNDKVNDKVIARFDTSTEALMESYNTYGEDYVNVYEDEIRKNIKTTYCENPVFEEGIEGLYKIDNKGNSNFKYGAPWLNDTKDIEERIKVDIYGGEYTNNEGTEGEKKYTGKSLINELNGRTIVEVINEIDRSKYLEDIDENGEKIKTNLPQQYNMPTVEIVYIILD